MDSCIAYLIVRLCNRKRTILPLKNEDSALEKGRFCGDQVRIACIGGLASLSVKNDEF